MQALVQQLEDVSLQTEAFALVEALEAFEVYWQAHWQNCSEAK